MKLKISYPKTEKNPHGFPLLSQAKFHNSQAKYRLFAGGFATGKTTSLILEIIMELTKYGKNYGVLGRKDLMELRSTTLKEFFDLCPKELIMDHNKQDRTITLYNGSQLFYMNLDDSREATEKIKSLNLGFVAIDQLEEIQETVFLAFVGRLRRNNTSRKFFATCNPAGHDWLWERWKNNCGKDYELFEAITLENKYLPEDYIEQLLQYPKNWVNRFVYCSWEDFAGLVYNEYKEMIHVINSYTPNEGDQHYIVVDYGFRNPTAVLFAATNYDGLTYIYDEYYQSGKLISEIVTEIMKNKYYRKAYTLIDPSAHNVQRDGKSVNDEFTANGIYFNRADNNVQQGINHVNEMFQQKKLFITRNCQETIREIGMYKWKELKPGQTRNEYEEPVKSNDHTCDAMRYLVNYIYTPMAPAVEAPRWLQELKRKQKKGFNNFMTA